VERPFGLRQRRAGQRARLRLQAAWYVATVEIHLGRLIDHVHLRVADLEASRRVYRAVLQALGRDLTQEGPGFFSADGLFVTPCGDDPPSRVHLAFQTRDREAVVHFHAAALAAGGADHGAPGERPCHPGCNGAYVLDPDGNNVEAVHHGPAERSASSVVLRAG
jgi:catechol 2,3-dioxygenase-like lactoylglutathione lyase family enzyme